MSRPIRVLLDARMLIGRFSGVARVVTRLVDELTRRDGVRVTVLCGSEPYAPWSGRDDLKVAPSSFDRHHRTARRRRRWEQANLPRLIADAKADIYHATWNSGIPRRAPVPSVLTIHDLIPWDHPGEYFSGALQAWCYRRSVRASALRAVCVTTVSEHVRTAVIDRLRVSPGKVLCVPNGVDSPAGLGEVGPAQLPYVLYVGGHEPRKNIAALFAAMQRYWRQQGMTLELRLTGRPQTLSRDAQDALRRLPPDAPVRFLGSIDDQKLSREYHGARALLLLSKAEGFGLPALEAMAHRCPVIAAACGALPEVIGSAGVLVNPEDSNQVCAALMSLLPASGFRDDLLACGQARAAAFTWSHAADQIIRIYRKALSPTHSRAPHFSPRQVRLNPA
jgi:glycosyltransferase involved in cell wall biosynthesis